ncbi:MAG: methyltransferase family protein, partial [Xanthobacteraceae bacterium]
MDSLSTKVLTQSVAFLAAAAIPIFLPAWSLDFWQAWLYLLAFGASMLAVGLYFAKHDPRLVERRMHVGMTAEKEPTQKIIQGLASFLLVAMFVTTGLDHQFRWSNVSPTISIVADALIALSFYVIFLTFKENTFAASTVTVEKDQAVVSTGPYAIVRHPMYAGAVILFVASPLAL